MSIWRSECPLSRLPAASVAGTVAAGAVDEPSQGEDGTPPAEISANEQATIESTTVAQVGLAPSFVEFGSPPTGGNAFPFGGGLFASTRYQQVCDATFFSGPGTIDEIQFFASLFGGSFCEADYEIRLSTTPKADNSLDLVSLSNNVGADDALFYSARLAGAMPTVVAFDGFDFPYDPSQGNLLIDIHRTNVGTCLGLSGFLDARNGDFGTDSSRAHDFGTQFESWGLTTAFVFNMNEPPVADPNGPYLFPLDAGPVDGTGSSDPDGDPLTFDWDYGDGNLELDAGATPSHTYADAGIYDVCLTVTDPNGASDTACTEAVIYDPTDGFVTGGGWIDSPAGAYYPQDFPFYNGSYYELFSSPEIPWDDAQTAVSQLANPACGYPHLAMPTTPAEEQFIVETFGEAALFGKWLGGYQADNSTPPSEGWGWVAGETWDYSNWNGGEPNDSPNPGENGEEQHLAYWNNGTWNDEGFLPLVTGYLVEYDECFLPEGKANFGFVSRYKKGASVPTGNTEFQFQTADLNFHSSSYDWLVVTGSDQAKFKGEGTINGEGEYKFMIWAGDDDPDTFRIKIWTEDKFGTETVVYDNGADQPISGGSIIVHTKGK